MAVRKRTSLLVGALLLTSIASAAAVADVQKDTVAENMGQQDKAFKMSPQDKTFGSNKFDEADKFKAPTKAPSGEENSLDPGTTFEKGNKAEEPAIIDDYDPNRLGVSAEDAAADQSGRKKPTKDQPAEESTPDSSDPKAGLSTGKGANSGGVGSASSEVTHKKTDSAEAAAHDDEEELEISSSGHFIMSFTMILMSEIGDKTFLVAALMGMRHNPWFVFSASYSALAIMTLLSAVLGTILPSLLSKKFTTILAAILFVVFGANLLREGLTMDAKGHVEEEMHEVEHEIELSELTTSQDDLEKGGSSTYTNNASKLSKAIEGISNLAGLVFSPLWVQIFIMTFLGEWGDRSQIATVALSAAGHFWDVCFGALAGHALCTLGAVIAGYFVATHLSMRTITLAGAIGFFVFGIAYLYEGLYTH